MFAEMLEKIEVAHLPFTALDAAEDLVQPVGTLAARRCLPHDSWR
jgi:hypothetical protein